jgi:RNA polymerase sigma-70 factor (ECF subfamily)
LFGQAIALTACITAEQNLVKHARDGCLTCRNQLIENNAQRLRSFVFKMSPNSPDTEDIFQQTVIRAIQRFDQFRGDSSFLTWLYSIAVNESRQLIRRQHIIQMLPLEEEEHATIRWHDDKSLKDASYNAPKRHSVRRAIETLPPSFKSVIELHDFEGHTLVEIASFLNTSVSATKTRHFRARKLVMAAMQKRPRRLLPAQTQPETLTQAA